MGDDGGEVGGSGLQFQVEQWRLKDDERSKNLGEGGVQTEGPKRANSEGRSSSCQELCMTEGQSVSRRN